MKKRIGKPVNKTDHAIIPPSNGLDKLKQAVKPTPTLITPENAGPWTVSSLQTVIRQNAQMIKLLTQLNAHFEKLNG